MRGCEPPKSWLTRLQSGGCDQRTAGYPAPESTGLELLDDQPRRGVRHRNQPYGQSADISDARLEWVAPTTGFHLGRGPWFLRVPCFTWEVRHADVSAALQEKQIREPPTDIGPWP